MRDRRQELETERTGLQGPGDRVRLRKTGNNSSKRRLTEQRL